MPELRLNGVTELDVADFGPIANGKLELRPLTVFVGPSNTGKSYLAVLIYALHKFFEGRFPYHWNTQGLGFGREANIERWPRTTIIELAERLLSSNGDSNSPSGFALPESVNEIIYSVLRTRGASLGAELVRCFGLQGCGALIRKGARGHSEMTLCMPRTSGIAPVSHTLKINRHKSELESKFPEGFQLTLDGRNEDSSSPAKFVTRWAERILHGSGDQPEYERRYAATELIDSLIFSIRPQVVGPLHLPAFYLPADRTGVMHAHSVVVSALIQSAPKGGLRPHTHTPVLSGILADFLDALINLARVQTSRRRVRRDLGSPIEEDIMGGSIHIERSELIDYPHFTYRPKGWKNNLSLMHASSMVSELAPVVLYLRHMVRPGSVLIIEEPESHLHPGMQVRLMRQLAKLVQMGIRVILTTHSEWIMEELANIVGRHAISGSDQKSAANPKIALGPDQVGTWLFKHDERLGGSVVHECVLDEESGLFATDFETVSQELHNDNVHIYNRTQAARGS